MLSDDDRKRLMRTVGREGATIQILLVCLAIFQVICAAVKFTMVGLWAHMGGYSLQTLLVIWFRGVSADASYPGVLIHAEDDIGAGLLLLGAALGVGALWWRGRQSREQTQRIINSLKGAGAW